MLDYTHDYLLNKKVTIYQPVEGYRASTDAVILSSLVSQLKNGEKILDVGSGTGAISLCLAERFKLYNPQIIGLELQAELAQLANLSAAANDFNFLQYINVDIRHKLPANLPNCSFNHVITNPPYAQNDMPSPNSSKATAHNFEAFSLTSWIDFCIKMLAPKGHFYIINRAEAITEILASIHGKLGDIQIIPLFSKSGQVAKRVMIKAQKDSKAPSIIHTGFVVHDEDGEYTNAAYKILREGQGLKF